VLVVAFIVYGVAGSATNLARSTGLLNDLTPTGMVLEQPMGTPSGWSRVTVVEGGSSAEAAGVRPGDLVHFENIVGFVTRDRAGWANPIVVERDGQRFRSAIAPNGRADTANLRIDLALFGIRALVALAFGALLVFRSTGNRAALQLGIILLGLGAATGGVLLWSPNPTIAAVRLLLPLTSATIAYFWILFSLEISGGSSDRRQARIITAVALAFFLATLTTEIALLRGANIPPVGPLDEFAILLVATNQLVGYLIIAINYRRNAPADRNRIKIVLIAFVCFMLATVLGRMTLIEITPMAPSVQNISIRLGLTALTFVGLGLLVYGVLRQKLFDLNFALNRTLVYATVSFVLLAAFGIAKWVIEHLSPESWHEGSEFYSFGIALLLFLSLHRVHDWVERNVERVFFSPWHQNEAALRRFVAAAGHFEQAATLCDAFTAEASRFAKGGGAALFLRWANGAYGQSGGNLADTAPTYPADDVALALMRAERRAVRTTEVQTALPGVLALPILDHGKLAGFLLLDRKGDGTDYRPDEVEVLGWAAHQVGLDLQAMRASELEAEVAGLNETVAGLRGVIAELSNARPPAPARTRKRA